MTHIDRARLQRLGIDPAQVTVEGRPETLVEEADRENPVAMRFARENLALEQRVEQLEARVAKVLEMRTPDGSPPWVRLGYEDALADVRATLRGEL